MAKKKPKSVMQTRLSDADIKQLANRLDDTGHNVYSLARTMFPDLVFLGETFDGTDDDWQRLRKIGGVFKCEQCNCWKTTDLEDSEVIDSCYSCVCAMAGEG